MARPIEWTCSKPLFTIRPTASPLRCTTRLSIAVPEYTQVRSSGYTSSTPRCQCASASSEELKMARDSSSGLLCALPTTNRPSPRTKKVSVIVPPASMPITWTCDCTSMLVSLLCQRSRRLPGSAVAKRTAWHGGSVSVSQPLCQILETRFFLFISRRYGVFSGKGAVRVATCTVSNVVFSNGGIVRFPRCPRRRRNQR